MSVTVLGKPHILKNLFANSSGVAAVVVGCVPWSEGGGTALPEIRGRVKQRAAHLSEEASTWAESAQGMCVLCNLFTAVFREAFIVVDSSMSSACFMS